MSAGFCGAWKGKHRKVPPRKVSCLFIALLTPLSHRSLPAEHGIADSCRDRSAIGRCLRHFGPGPGYIHGIRGVGSQLPSGGGDSMGSLWAPFWCCSGFSDPPCSGARSPWYVHCGALEAPLAPVRSCHSNRPSRSPNTGARVDFLRNENLRQKTTRRASGECSIREVDDNGRLTAGLSTFGVAWPMKLHAQLSSWYGTVRLAM